MFRPFVWKLLTLNYKREIWRKLFGKSVKNCEYCGLVYPGDLSVSHDCGESGEGGESADLGDFCEFDESGDSGKAAYSGEYGESGDPSESRVSG